MSTLNLRKEERGNNEEDSLSMGSAGKTGQLYVKKMKSEYSLVPYTKIN